MTPLELNRMMALIGAFRGSVSEGLDVIVNIPIKGQPSMRSRQAKTAYVRSLVIREYRAKVKKGQKGVT